MAEPAQSHYKSRRLFLGRFKVGESGKHLGNMEKVTYACHSQENRGERRKSLLTNNFDMRLP